jgi:DNA-binding IclR family transcriptional regulator
MPCEHSSRRSADRAWAEMIDQLEEGLTGLTVPLRDHREQLVGAIGVTAPTQRMVSSWYMPITSSSMRHCG